MKIWESFLDLLFPPKCPFCRNILDDPRAPVCPECQGKLPWLLGAFMPMAFCSNCPNVRLL